MRHKFLLLYSWFVRTIMYFLPDIPFIMRFRGFLYGLGMEKCGKDFQVTHNAIIKGLEKLCIGNNCFVGNGSILMGNGPIIIANQVLIAQNAIIISGNHTSKDGSYRYGKGDIGVIKLEYGAWVAGNCVVLKDSTLPSNSVLAACSVLNNNFTEPNAIYAGHPAKLIKIRN